MSASPRTTRTKPAISCCARTLTSCRSAVAATPSATNTTVKPGKNGRLATVTRRATPRCPRRSRVDGGNRREVARNERKHTRGDHRREPRSEGDDKADDHSNRRELFLEPALELGVERRASVRLGTGRGRRGLARVAPAPRVEPDHRASADQGDQRKQPGEQSPPAGRRGGADPGPELRHELVHDLAAGVAAVDPPDNEGTNSVGGGRVGHVEWRPARRAHQLPFELVQRRLLLARERRRHADHERRGQNGQRPHDVIAASMPSAS